MRGVTTSTNISVLHATEHQHVIVALVFPAWHDTFAIPRLAGAPHLFTTDR
jgi:hypothetical protein